jgi:DNA-binding NarL/FixJ family response regulator
MNERASVLRMLIAEDHALVRQGIRGMLASEPDLEVVAEAQNGQEALELCREYEPDLVLMDVRMPQMDGLEATRAIKAEFPTTSVLMVTSQENPDYLLEAVRAGAAGYVLKEATKDELLDSVRRVLNGEPMLDQGLAMRLLRRVADETDEQTGPPPESPRKLREPLSQPPAVSLSPREIEVLKLLALGKTNREIGQTIMVSLSSVKTYMRRIMDKLRVSDRTQAAVRAVELGLLPDHK